jgi:hypothetical protein
MFDGYVIVNPNAPSEIVVFARIWIVTTEPCVTVWLAGLIFTEFVPGCVVGVAVGTAVGTAVVVGETVIVPPVTVVVTEVPAASAKLSTVRPIEPVPDPVALRVIVMSPRSVFAAIPFALNPAVLICPAVAEFVVRLRPDVISAMLPNVNMFDGYVTVNPNAPSEIVVFARIWIVTAVPCVTVWLAGLILTEFAPVVGVAVGVGPPNVTVPPVDVHVTVVPAASAKLSTVRPIFAVPAAAVVALSTILISPRSAFAAIPFALNPAVLICPAVAEFVVRLRPDVISAMLPNVNMFDG